MKAKSLILIMVIFPLAFIGCAEKKEVAGGTSGDNTTSAVGSGTVPNEGGTQQTGFQPDDEGWGIPVPLTVDIDNFTDFTARSTSDLDLENTKLYYKLEKEGDKYRATFRVYYRYTTVIGGWGDNFGESDVQQRSPKFESGTTETDIQFNKVYRQDGKTYWIAFAEEKVWNPQSNTYKDFTNFEADFGGPAPFGSIMIVLDDVSESGSSGTIYYKNFKFSQCFDSWGTHICPDKPDSSNENYKCWNIKAGPYQCREFVKNNNPTNEMLKEVNGIAVEDLDSPDMYKVLGRVEGLFIPGLN